MGSTPAGQRWGMKNSWRQRMSVSTRRSLPERQVASVEAYLLDFDRDIYGEQLKLEFVERLRDEMKFESVERVDPENARRCDANT
jgi:FAD synthase